MSLKPQNADQRSPIPSHAHNPTSGSKEARRRSPGTSPSLPFPGNSPTETERKPHVEESPKTSFRTITEVSDCSGSSSNAGGLGFKFSWDDMCLYLYGRLAKEPVILRHDRGDRTPNGKRSGDEEEESTEKLGERKRRKPSSPQAAALVFPDEVKLCTSSVPGAGLGVCASRPIPLGTWIGPYEGQVVSKDELTDETDTKYMWEIYKERKFSHYIDGKDKRLASWMRFIKCARYKEEQNMTVFQYCGNIYYRAFKAIPVGTELLVWYDEKYSEFIDVPALLKERESTSALKRDQRSLTPHESGIEEELMYNQSREQERLGMDDPSTSQEMFKFDLRDNGDPHVWKCGQCSQTFTQRVLLQMHICSQAPEKPYQCGHCPASFEGPNDLREHVVIHVNEKPFKCGFCGRSFAGATTLNNHIRTHTGEKPFKCNKCLRNFSQSTQLSRHQKSPEDCAKGN